MKEHRRSLRLFFAAAVVTALGIFLFSAAVIAEKNSRATGLGAVRQVFSATMQDGRLLVTVNDRQGSFSLRSAAALLESPVFWSLVSAGMFF